MNDTIVILGAGLAGLSSSYHLGHDRCVLFEAKHHAGGHIHTEFVDGFTWDEGPHISFTKHQYVRDLFAESVDGEFLEYAVETGNYYQGHWIPHPAQSNLFAVPEPLRSACLRDFHASRETGTDELPANYGEWLHKAFGATFAQTFPAAYTRKYWTLPPERMTTDWVGERVYYPSVDDVTKGAEGPLPEQTHYIKKIRYPARGGYMSYARKLLDGADIRFDHELTHVSFADRRLLFANGASVTFDRLVSTLPLPVLIERSDAPFAVREAATELLCTSLLVVNVTADHPTARPENWVYVYDEDKHATRINCTEKLSPHNAPDGKTGIQVEVYFSKEKPLAESHHDVAAKVCRELVEMGMIESMDRIESVHTQWLRWANVAFDLPRRDALRTVLDWLEGHGLAREADELAPVDDWDTKLGAAAPTGQSIILAGRYAQWKYYWTDDCVLRGADVAACLGT
ncbi:MAG: FAD-dependent oxidoreductase [Trueperaceae bacterium]|nr:FAD-dependent oxidoreductase [Trueperaceae bacterium]